jgi:hypothetical protein
MRRKTVNKFPVLFASFLILSMAAGTASASVIGADEIKWDGSSWGAATMSTNGPYTSIVSERFHGNHFYASRASGGVDDIEYHNGAWLVSSATSATYTSLLTSYGNQQYSFLGARAGGGVDSVAWDGSQYVTTQVNANTYTAITAERGTSPEFYGMRAGGLDDIYLDHSGVWHTDPISSNTYTAVVADPTLGAFTCYAAGASGVDKITWDGSAYVTSSVNDHVYTALAASNGSSELYGILASGGVEGFSGSGGGFEAISSVNYKQIVADGLEPYTLYGLTADGAVDQMQYGTAWTTKFSLVGSKYASICGSLATNGDLAGIPIPEPSTLVLLSMGLVSLLAYAWRKRK